uniref:UvrABC system protein B n=1 Tax=Anaerolinea thermolimosa TaxID=229919 RepID=A0A7C4PJX3_9CHLR
MFRLNPEYTPKGDQPQAIEKLVQGLEAGYRFQTLLGATGTGKTFTMASVIARVQRPALVIAHNKTLAAQLCQEFRAFFPENAVQFFISYYDYYQPEAYVPQTDTYIEKTASINDEIDRLRHAATQAVLERRDVIVVASVSCIYGLGSPTEYLRSIVTVKRGDCIDPRELAMRLVELQYVRSDMVLGRGTFRIRGDVIDVQPADDEFVTRIELFGDEVERIYQYDPLKGDILAELERAVFFPATHYVTPWDRMDSILEQIRAELEEQVRYFESQGRLIEAQRIRQRTEMDIEMMRELGYCNGIENYSRYFDGRKPGEPPYTLLDYFPEDYIVFIDESHQTIPQLRGMYNGDLQRKRMLVEYGFRLPSAMDNRPLRFEEFLQRVGQVIFVSATPGPYEREVSEQIVEQIIRPTGLLDPEVIVRPTQGQIDDLIGEIRKRIERQERVLVTTLTKKMAEDLTSYLQELGIKVQYLHSDIQSLERAEILRDLRLGTYDVVVGVNLLREGLDLPEVSLVAILDADKEGFLRSETSLIQTFGRCARNVSGKVILYADQVTPSMKRAIEETNRRRRIQESYNRKHRITPETIRKSIPDILDSIYERDYVTVPLMAAEKSEDFVPLTDIPRAIRELKKAMRQAAAQLDFEKAAELRDRIRALEEKEMEYR